MGHVRIYEGHGADSEKHEGAGTGLDLTIEDVLAEALGILEPREPYYELHRGAGTRVSLDAGEVMAEVEEILKAGEIIEAVDAYLDACWKGTPVMTAETKDEQML